MPDRKVQFLIVHPSCMLNTIRLLAIATVVVAGGAPIAFAGYQPPQDRDSAFIDSGRNIDGQVSPVPNYGTSDRGTAGLSKVAVVVLKNFRPDKSRHVQERLIDQIQHNTPAKGSVIVYAHGIALLYKTNGFQHCRQICRLLSKFLWDGVTWPSSRSTAGDRSCCRGWRAPIGAR